MRNPSRVLTQFTHLLYLRCMGRPLRDLRVSGPCLVLGSAPEPRLPDGFDESWTLVTVNASQAGLKQLGCDRVPDLTVMSGQMLGRKPANLAGQEAIRGQRTRHLILIERGALDRDESVAVLARHRFSYDQITTITSDERSKIVLEVLKKPLALGDGNEKVSTGMFAALLACYLGARPIVLAGFSLEQAGHSYDDRGLHREHVEYDHVALSYIGHRGLPFFAVDERFAKQSGRPQWGSRT